MLDSGEPVASLDMSSLCMLVDLLLRACECVEDMVLEYLCWKCVLRSAQPSCTLNKMTLSWT